MGWFGKKGQGKQAATSEAIASTVGNYVLADDNASPATAMSSSKKQYVAPIAVVAPASLSQSSLPVKSLESHITEAEEEEMVVVDRPIQNATTEDGYGDIENAESPSYSREGESDPMPSAHLDMRHSSKNNHLNSLFNGHLMKWKFDAEEGTAFLRVPACT
jgi:hypothetical protein